MLFDWNFKMIQSDDNLPMHSLDFNPIEFLWVYETRPNCGRHLRSCEEKNLQIYSIKRMR